MSDRINVSINSDFFIDSLTYLIHTILKNDADNGWFIEVVLTAYNALGEKGVWLQGLLYVHPIFTEVVNDMKMFCWLKPNQNFSLWRGKNGVIRFRQKEKSNLV